LYIHFIHIKEGRNVHMRRVGVHVFPTLVASGGGSDGESDGGGGDGSESGGCGGCGGLAMVVAMVLIMVIVAGGCGDDGGRSGEKMRRTEEGRCKGQRTDT
jgi:hypothetical protein